MPEQPVVETELTRRLAGVALAERRRLLLELVCTHVADVIDRLTPDTVDADRPIRSQGLGSLAAVGLVHSLTEATGVPLPITVVFDHPTATRLTDYLLGEMFGATDVVAEADLPVAADEPIAIVGMACRYPGGVASAEDLWRLVTEGGDAITEFPADRGWDLAGLYDPAGRPGTSYTRHGGFLTGAGEFDAGFFQISPREAQLMDPQQRLLLETSWEAIERAGIDPHALRGSQTAVFVGANAQSYSALLSGAPEQFDGHSLTGRLSSVISGRVSYALGLEGPAVTVDTACSSSLVALHLAVRALRSGDCSLALTGGVTVMSTPELFVDFSRQGGLSRDGRCRAFAASAEGIGWSEGVGMVLLERLSDAQRHGHQVLAVVRGSATNQDGASNGLSAPSGLSQQRVIRQALADAGLSARDVTAVEAHGTGTTVGDPIEAQALLTAYGQDRDEPLWLGSVKSNLGHTQQAAGVAGVIKMVMALRHGLLPATLHVDEPTSHADWSAGNIQLLTEAREWTGPRRAGVSSFGVSGTNAHVLLEEAPEAARPAKAHVAAPWVLSARSDTAIREMATRLREFVLADAGLDVADVAFSLATGRSRFEHRAAVVGQDRDELVASLDALADGDPAVVRGVAGADGRVVFVFAGQGGQWLGMGVDLLETSAVFAERMHECERALAPHVDWSLIDVLRQAEGAPGLNRVDVVQPVLFAMMVSLAALWRSYGVVPSAVVGHSQGEIAAACVAGALSLEDAAKTVALRAKALLTLSGECGMAFVSASVSDVTQYLKPWADRLGVAVVNSPKSVVVAGDRDAIEELLDWCDDEGLRAGKVGVTYASHSPQVEAIRERLLAELSDVRPQAGEIPMYSTVDAAWIGGTRLTAEYWYRNLRQTVRFDDVVRGLLGEGYRGFVEISPHPVLTVAIQQTVEDAGADAFVAGTLRRDDGGLDRFLTSLSEVHVSGGFVDWRHVFDGSGAQRLDIPTYPFQHERYWVSPPSRVGDLAAAGLAPAAHPLLGATVELPGHEGFVCTGRLSRRTVGWLADHRVMGSVLLPGTAFAELVSAACGGGHVRELTLRTPLLLSEEDTDVHVTVGGAGDGGGREVNVYAKSGDGAWTCHAAGIVDASPSQGADLVAWPPADADPVAIEGVYESLATRGYDYGPAFQGLRAMWRRGNEIYAEVVLPEDLDADGFGVHPALLDAALQPVIVDDPDQARLPFTWSGFSVYAVGATALRVRLTLTGPDAVSVAVADTTGQAVATIESVRFRPASEARLQPGASNSLYRLDWIPAPAGDAVEGRWPVLGDGLADALRSGGLDIESYADLKEITSVPYVVLAEVRPGSGAHVATRDALALLQSWLADERFSASRLVVVTRAGDLGAAAVWGLVRSAQTENPDRFVLVEMDESADSVRALPVAIGCREAQVAIRDGVVSMPRLARADSADVLVAPADSPWRVDVVDEGTIDGIGVTTAPDTVAALGTGEIRVAVRAAGVNFRDVLCALGMYPEDVEHIGSEAAGVVVEVGPGVQGLAAGDRVMGLMAGSLGPSVVTDHRLVTRLPQDWSFVDGASVPVAFLTALYGLSDIGGVRAGDRVLVHAAAGGVGMAAVQLARVLGADVVGTASPAKWGATGLGEGCVASSRDVGFAQKFGSVDVVLNSLAGEFVDASLGMLSPGGRFVEMGKTDLRDSVPGGIAYRPFDLLDAGPDRIQAMLRQIAGLFEQGELKRLPVRTWPVNRARAAFRFMAQARHVGKIVLTVDTFGSGTVLVTGGTGLLGALVARRLVVEHGVQRLLLASRSGWDAPGAGDLVAELVELGATAEVAACDVSDRDALEQLLAEIPAEHPLTAVVHAAGVLDDGVLETLTPERVDAVLAPKVGGAWHLHELTAEMDLSAFVVFSSVAGVFGTAGQASYAAASAFLDGLMSHRRDSCLPGVSLAWGLWAEASAMTGHLGRIDLARVNRNGMVPMTTERGLALFDEALRLGDALVLPVQLDLTGLRAVPPLLQGLAGVPARRAANVATGGGVPLAQRLAALPASEQDSLLLELVRGHAAEVLGQASPDAVAVDRGFKELGFDSLTAVELRNRLTAVTGLRLVTTLVFDHPTVGQLARHLRDELAPVGPGAADRVISELERLSDAMSAIPDEADRARVATRLRKLAEQWGGGSQPAGTDLSAASADELFALIDKGIS